MTDGRVVGSRRVCEHDVVLDIRNDPVLFELARDVDRRCRLRGSFQLRSGIVADEYFDKYLFEADPQLLRRITERMVALVPEDTEMLGGLELGGIPLVTMLSQLTGLPSLFIRKKAKTYGTQQLAEGGEVRDRRIVLIEDVITTGGAVVAATEQLRSRGAIVDTVICAIDRSNPDINQLPSVQVGVRPVLTKQILDTVHQQ
ncbi:orotate phosphoribosyltransferase [Nocardia sp. NPDC056952]|uniref:orotate phosphoribosyltransferase n=1 Tax=Nocardia sp. NPDC056952 TaxID=3345979 RepID=UPI003643A753